MSRRITELTRIVKDRAARTSVVTVVATPQVAPAERSMAGQREFIALVISLMAMSALAIDMMLPTFPDIRAEFGMPADSAEVAWIITAFFLGMAAGPWLYGPISDKYGRRRPLFAGMAVYIVGATMASLAPSFGLMIVSRIVWGLGSAAPRSLSLAVIRDRYEGSVMARLMSMIMAVFLLVPIIAPTLGAGLNSIAPWRVVFFVPVVAAVGVTTWAIRRLPETLPPEHRRPFTRASVIEAGKAVVSNRQTMCFTAAMMFLFGVMTGYLASSELILEDVYGYGDYFPVFFGGVGLLLALSSLNNARLVGRLGVTVLLRRMAVIGVAVAAVMTMLSMLNGGRPNFWLFTFLVAITVPLAQGLIPSSNAAAMTPLPHVAGTASAIIATITTAGGALLGNLVTAVFDGTVRPFAICLLVFMSISAALILFGATTRGHEFTSPAVAIPDV